MKEKNRKFNLFLLHQILSQINRRQGIISQEIPYTNTIKNR